MAGHVDKAVAAAADVGERVVTNAMEQAGLLTKKPTRRVPHRKVEQLSGNVTAWAEQ